MVARIEKVKPGALVKLNWRAVDEPERVTSVVELAVIVSGVMTGTVVDGATGAKATPFKVA